MERQGHLDVVFWVSLDYHNKVDVLAHKGLRLIELTNSNRYHGVTTEIVGTTSTLNIVDAVTKSDITIGNPPDQEILLVSSKEREYNSFKGYVVPLYECIFHQVKDMPVFL